MNKEIIKEQIIRSLEDILDQTNAIFENDGKIPLIELDIIKANVRKLYEQYANLNTHNIILSEPISSHTQKANTVSKPVAEPIVKKEIIIEKAADVPELVIRKEKPVVVIEEVVKASETREEQPKEEKRSILKFEMISEPEIEVSEPKETIETPLVAEIEAIADPVVEEVKIAETKVEELVQIEEQIIIEETPIIEEVVEEAIAEETPVIVESLEMITPEIIVEAEIETKTEPVIEEITNEEPKETIIEEPIATAPKMEISDTLFPDLFGEQPIEEKPEAVKRKRPKSPLDLFADNTQSIADKFKDEKTTVNDRLSEKKEDNSIAAKMQNQVITDIKKAIGINEKFLFINELFDGNMAEYNQAVDHLNANCKTKEEAEAYIVFLKQNYNWNDARTSVTLFSNLVERRFPNS